MINFLFFIQIPDHPLERVRQFQPLSHTAKQSSRNQSSTYSGRSPRRSHPDTICPKVEVAPSPGNGSVVEVTRGVVLVEGEEDEDYSHVITTEPATSAGEGMSTSLSSPTFFACIILLFHIFIIVSTISSHRVFTYYFLFHYHFIQ